MRLQTIPMSEIYADEEFNCRGAFSPIDVVDLAKDIDRQGLIQPITVCLGDNLPPGKKYKLLAGFRRFKAHIVLKKIEISAVVKDEVITDAEARCINLAENLHRKDLNVLQEAKALRHLFLLGMVETDIANKLGQSRGWVQIRAMLLKLPEEVQREVEAGMVLQTNIRELYMIHRNGKIEDLYKAVRSIKDQRLRGKKNVSVHRNLDPDQNASAYYYKQKSEIEKMTIALVEHGFKGVHTRALAWASGAITLNEFLTDLYKWAVDNNISGRPLTKEELDALCTR